MNASGASFRRPSRGLCQMSGISHQFTKSSPAAVGSSVRCSPTTAHRCRTRAGRQFLSLSGADPEPSRPPCVDVQSRCEMKEWWHVRRQGGRGSVAEARTSPPMRNHAERWADNDGYFLRPQPTSRLAERGTARREGRIRPSAPRVGSDPRLALRGSAFWRRWCLRGREPLPGSTTAPPRTTNTMRPTITALIALPRAGFERSQARIERLASPPRGT